MTLSATVQPLFQPDRDAIRQHLGFVFGDAGEYSDGKVEIAIINKTTGNKVYSGWFDADSDGLGEAADYAARENATPGNNVYFGAALRDPLVLPTGRGSDDDFYALTAVYVDLDDLAAVEKAAARWADHMPAFLVATGTQPHARLQAWWPLQEPITDPDEVRSVLQGLARRLDGDTSVTNPGRIMRLAGSIAWAAKPGRVTEPTQIVPINHPPKGKYSVEQIKRWAPPLPFSTETSVQPVHTSDVQRATGLLGLPTGDIEDGREKYMRDTILAVFIEMVGTTGSIPTAQELNDEAWPQYAEHVSFSRPGRGPDEFAEKCQYTINRFHAGRLPKLKTEDDVVAAYNAKLKAEQAKQEQVREERKAEAEETIQAKPYRFTPGHQIPQRQWVYGRHLIRRFVSATIAPGGVGKSMLTAVEAVAMACGKPLMDVYIDRPMKVWLWNLEDPQEEIERRLTAIVEHYKLQDSVHLIEQNLFVNSGRDTRICVADYDEHGVLNVTPDIEVLAAEIQRHGIDVITVDPFVSSHKVSENDNGAMDTVVKAWTRLAEQCNVAVELVHHTRKMGDAQVTAESARGGKALVDAARDVRVLNQMTENEGATLEVENHRLHVKVHSDKMNLAPPADKADWFKLVSVSLGNGPLGNEGDRVGVPVPWKPAELFDGITTQQILEVMQAIKDGATHLEESPMWSPSKRGENNERWVGNAVMQVLGISEKRAAKMVTAWLDSGVLADTTFTYKRRKDTKGVVVDDAVVAEWRA
jgi:hypothetical protein